MARTPAKKSSAKKTTTKKSAAKTTRSTKTTSAAAKPKRSAKTAPAKKKVAKKVAKSKTATSKATKAKSTKPKATKKKSAVKKSEEVTISRRKDVDRRDDEKTPLTPTVGPKLERREKVNRRRQIDPTTCERDYSEAEVEFMNALDEYKRKNGRMFPTCSEVLEVIRELGYVQLGPAEIAARKATEGPTENDIDSQVEAEAQEALELSGELHVETFNEMPEDAAELVD